MVDARFSGQTAIVTGAGSGIGRATALRMAAEGASVIVSDIVADRVEETVNLITEAGGQAKGVVGDISAQAHTDELVAACDGKIDVLVNNAGIMDGFVPIGELEDDLWNRVMSINVTGPMQTIRAVIPIMVGAGGGTIVNVSSAAGNRGGAAGTAYTTSKHALNGMTRSVSALYRGKGIRCNAVMPGGVETNIGETAAPASDYAFGVLSPGFATAGASASSEALAGAICFFASSDSTNITGEILASDGGWASL